MKDLRGYFYVLGAAIFWGGSATAAKFLLNANVDTINIVQARVTFTALLLFPFLLIFRRKELRVSPRDVWKFLLLGIAGVAGSNFMYYFTIKESTVATGILIQYTAPLLVMLYAAWSGEEKPTTTKILAATISLTGCFLAVGAYNAQVFKISSLGLTTGLLSSICFAFLSLYTRSLLKQFPFWTVTFYAIVGASVFWLVVRPPWMLFTRESAPYPLLPLFLLAIVSILIPHSLYFSGLRLVLPSRAIITSTLEPVVAISTAALFLGEYLSSIQVFGAVLVIAAVMILQIRREPDHLLNSISRNHHGNH